MREPPGVSVIIPSRGVGPKLSRCLRDLAHQEVVPVEVLVGLDGGTDEQARRLRVEQAEGLDDRLEVIAFEKRGYMPMRARLLERARADVFVSLNDDVRLGPGFIGEHARAHAGWDAAGPLVVAGRAEWVRVERPSVFDEAVRLGDMVFFRQRPDERGGVGYRECYGLNMSASVRAALGAGGFAAHADLYGYDDIELAHRMVQNAGASVRYAHDAVVEHDHRHTPTDVMRREYELGRAAWTFAKTSHSFARDLFGRDVTVPDEIAHWRQVLRRQVGDAVRVEASMLELGETPAAEEPVSPVVARVIAQHWVPLKRLLWGWGLVDASMGIASRWSLLRDGPELP